MMGKEQRQEQEDQVPEGLCHRRLNGLRLPMGDEAQGRVPPDCLLSERRPETSDSPGAGVIDGCSSHMVVGSLT